jgi:putative transposase
VGRSCVKRRRRRQRARWGPRSSTPGPTSRARAVDTTRDDRHRFGVEPICAVLSEHDMKIAPQTYYRWLACPVRPTELAEAYLVNQIVDLYRRNKCVYGERKMWHAACRAGLRVGRDQVGRLMRIAGIQGVRRGTHRTTTTTRNERAPRHPDLVKRG